ncbi:MAG: hypothetical protein ACREEO_09985 [Phenylobacterium sp.]
MTWLTRLENLYLNILRVVILVLATILLLGAVGLAVYAAPKLMPEATAADERKLVSGDSLQDYRRELSGGEAATALPSETDAMATSGKIDSRIKTAAAAIAAYIQKTSGHAVPLAGVETFLVERQSSLPATLQGDYADSLVRLGNDLGLAKAPVDDLDGLIEWHFERFTAAKAEAEAQELRQAAEAAAKQQTALAMGAAAVSLFVMFLLLVFGFVLVKMERNLRLVAVRGGEAAAFRPA